MSSVKSSAKNPLFYQTLNDLMFYQKCPIIYISMKKSLPNSCLKINSWPMMFTKILQLEQHLWQRDKMHSQFMRREGTNEYERRYALFTHWHRISNNSAFTQPLSRMMVGLSANSPLIRWLGTREGVAIFVQFYTVNKIIRYCDTCLFPIVS